VTWRVRLLNSLLIAIVLATLIELAQVRIRSVLYSAVDRTLREQADQMARMPQMQHGDHGPFDPHDPFKPGDSGEMAPPPPPRDRADHRFGTLALRAPMHIPLNTKWGPTPWSVGGVAAARTQGEDERIEVEADDTRLLVYSRLVKGTGGDPGAIIQTAASLEETETALSEIQTALFGLLLPLTLAAGIFGAMFTDIALVPVHTLTRAVAQLDATNLAARLPAPGGKDTFDRLVTMLNALLARLDAAFARQKRFTADASHELRTPLAVIKAATSLLLETPESLTDLQRRALERADMAADRSNRLISDLLLLARTESGALPIRYAEIDLALTLACAVREAETAHAAPHAPVTLDLADDRPLRTDPDHLHRLVVNLLGNALRHTPISGAIRIAARTDADRLTLRVTDNGEGIVPEALTRLGEAFYRPDAARTRTHGGAGLGLALCKGIAAALGGTLELASTVGEGTTVTVQLPFAPSPLPES